MALSQKNVEAIERSRTLKGVLRCEEYEKMISGMPFRSWESPELEGSQQRATGLCKLYNDTGPWDERVDRTNNVLLRMRTEFLQSLLGDVQGNPRIVMPFTVTYGCNISIGRNLYANRGFSIDDSALVTIGDDVTIGPDVCLITINHATDVAQRLHGVMYARPITIGSACWIGCGAMILPGAKVGYGCTIGAGAVVRGTIPDYSVAVGNPARVVKRVFPSESASTTADKVGGADSRNLHDQEKDARDEGQ